MTHNLFQVLRSRKVRQCTVCSLRIEPAEQEVFARSGVYHVSCYPLTQQYPISISAVCSRDKPVPEVVAWIAQHNLQFQPPVPPPSLLSFSIPYSPRLLLPCLLYLDPRSIVNASAVCRVWYNCYSHPELWQSLISRDYPKAVNSLSERDKSAYFRLQRERCYHCRENRSSEICPLVRKPLCLECRLTEDFTLVTKREIEKRLGLAASWVERRHLPFIPAFGRSQTTYQWMLNDEIQAVRSSLKRRVIALFSHKRVQQELMERVSFCRDFKCTPEDPLLACVFEYIERADDSRQSYAAMVRKATEILAQS